VIDWKRVNWNSTSWSTVPGSLGASRLFEVAAVSANHSDAVGGTLSENWNGTSWSLLPTSSGVSVNAVTALSDCTVVATGIGSSGGVILSNVATGIGSSDGVILSNSPTPAVAPATPVGTTASASTKPLRVPLDAALVDQFFATAGKVEQPLSLAGHRSRTHDTAANGALDALSGGMWLWDRA
jgi:hypothetical protein